MIESPQTLDGAVIKSITSFTNEHVKGGPYRENMNHVFRLVIETDHGKLIYEGCAGYQPFIKLEGIVHED